MEAPRGPGQAQYRPASLEPAPSGSGDGNSSAVAEHPLLKYRKGIDKATGRHHATVATAARANEHIASTNDLETRGAVPATPEILESTTTGDAAAGTAGNSEVDGAAE